MLGPEGSPQKPANRLARHRRGGKGTSGGKTLAAPEVLSSLISLQQFLTFAEGETAARLRHGSLGVSGLERGVSLKLAGTHFSGFQEFSMWKMPPEGHILPEKSDLLTHLLILAASWLCGLEEIISTEALRGA